jgi:hypothetical protein
MYKFEPGLSPGFLWQKKADPGDPQKFTLALVIRVEKLSKRAVTSRVKRGAAPFL